MSWLQKLLPPKIKRSPGAAKKAVPEGLWVKCEVCEAVLYRADLEKSFNVCPKCSHHNRVTARERLDITLDPEGRYEIGSEVGAGRFPQVRRQPALHRSAGGGRGRRPARPMRWW